VEIRGARVGQASGRSLGHEHADVVAAAAFGLHRVVRDQLRRHLDVEHPFGEHEGRHHATPKGAGTSAAR
jgi:hypothetical protein